MTVVVYTPTHFPLVARAAARARGARSLAHRPFVDHYYAGGPWCRLYLALDHEGDVAAVMGLEQIPFEYRGRPLTLGCASNFATLRPGAGGVLFMQWVRSSELACVFGGSPDTHRIVRSQGWTYFHGIRVLRLDRPYVGRAGEPWWRVAVKAVAQGVRPRIDVAGRTAAAALAAAVEVQETEVFSEDLLPASSPFDLRLAPSVDYLRWRYAPGLTFVRYRLFRIVRGAAVRGYVVMNDRPDSILVAHADADDPRVLAAGILGAISRLAAEQRTRREVVLACAHTELLEAFAAVGFRADPDERPFALGSRRRSVELDADTSRWLIHYDWIDNGLRAPFLDQDATTVAPDSGSPEA